MYNPYGSFQPPSNPLTKIQNFINNPFPSIAGMFKKATGTQQFTNPYYQVKPGDTLTNLGIPAATYTAANNGIKTLPPPGSYISTGVASHPSPNVENQAVTGQMNAQAYLNAGSPGANNARGVGNYNMNYVQPYRPSFETFMPSKYTPPTQADVLTEITQNSSMVAMGMTVKQISYQAAASLGLTPEQMQSDGYVPNAASGKWELPANGAVVTGGWKAPNAYTGAPGSRGNRSGVAIRNAKGTLENGRRRNRGDGTSSISIGSNASTSPTTVLGQRLSSG